MNSRASENELLSTNFCQSKDKNLCEEKYENEDKFYEDDGGFNIDEFENCHSEDKKEFVFEAEVEDLPPLELYFEPSDFPERPDTEEHGMVVKIPENQKENNQRRNSEIGETKNIPKNFGKQIIKFVKNNAKIIEKILRSIKSKTKYLELNTEMQKRKKKMSKISDLKNLWLTETLYCREMRIISDYYLRKYGYYWIFNSRITEFKSHLKYRSILLKVISDPHQFKTLKRDF